MEHYKTFSQVDISLSRKYEGSSIELIISKKLVEMMNGEIWLESSEPGVGNTFSRPLSGITVRAFDKDLRSE